MKPNAIKGEIETMNQEHDKKRLFLALLGLSLLLILASGLLLLFFISRGKDTFFFPVITVIALLLCGVIVVAFLGILIMVCIALFQRPLGPTGKWLIRFALFFYPVAMRIGKIFRMDINKVRGSFIALNNQLIHSQRIKIPAEKIIVLLPHCLQHFECGKKVANSLNNCVGCGRCDLGAIKNLCQKTGVHAVVVNGGTLARKTVKEVHPAAIVAVACEQDLFSGILDVQPLPALGILNIRPEGPCHNTRVDVSRLEEAIRFFSDSTKM